MWSCTGNQQLIVSTFRQTVFTQPVILEFSAAAIKKLNLEQILEQSLMTNNKFCLVNLLGFLDKRQLGTLWFTNYN